MTTMTTRKRHSPEQVMRKLAQADRTGPRRMPQHQHLLVTLAQARVVISDWKQDYNTRRRHSSLGYQAPAVYAAACTHP
jgi:transposase InsO family protein